jgi:hypothetical protein
MTLDEVANSLPNGFHDAEVRSFFVDYRAREAKFELDIWVGDLSSKDPVIREAYQSVELTLVGLVFHVVEPPDSRYPYRENDHLTIDIGEMHDLSKPPSMKLPPVPDGAFATWMFVLQWNSFMYFAAREARLVWL